MKSFYKYLIFFILGIILCIMFKKNLIEGLQYSFTDIFNIRHPDPHLRLVNPRAKLYDNIKFNTRSVDEDYLTITRTNCGGSTTGNGFTSTGITSHEHCTNICNRDDNCIGYVYVGPDSARCKFFYDDQENRWNYPDKRSCDRGEGRRDIGTNYSTWIKKSKVRQLISPLDNQYFNPTPNHDNPDNLITGVITEGQRSNAYLSLQDGNPYGIITCFDDQIISNGRYPSIPFEHDSQILRPDDDDVISRCETCPLGTSPNRSHTACERICGPNEYLVRNEQGQFTEECRPLPENSTGLCFKSFNNLEYGDEVDLCTETDYHNIDNPRTAVAFSHNSHPGRSVGTFNGYDRGECGSSGELSMNNRLGGSSFFNDYEKVLIIGESDCGYKVKWFGGGRRRSRHNDVWIRKDDILEGSIRDFGIPGPIDFYCDAGYVFQNDRNGGSCLPASVCHSNQINDIPSDNISIWSDTESLWTRTRPCRSCEDGTTPNNDQASCVPCSEGRAGTDGTCHPCNGGTQPNDDKTSCVDCPIGTGKSRSISGTCEQCEIGIQYAPPHVRGGGINYCRPVTEGTYSLDGRNLIDLPNNSTVSNISPYYRCNNGYGDNPNQDDPQKCIQCPPGYYGTNGDDPYDSGNNNRDCQLCPSSHYQDEAGQSECKIIPENGIGTSDSNGVDPRRGFKDFECSGGYLKSNGECILPNFDSDYSNDDLNAQNYYINGRRMDQDVKLTSLTSSDLNLLEINPNCETHDDGSSVNPILCDSDRINRANYYISNTNGLPTKCTNGRKPNDNRDGCVPCGRGEYCPYGLPLTCNEVEPDSFNEQNPISDDNPFYACTGEKLHKIGNISSSVDNKTIIYDSDNRVNEYYNSIINSQYIENIGGRGNLYNRLKIPLPGVDDPADNLLICPAGFKCDRYNPLTSPEPCISGEYCPEGTDIFPAPVCPNGYRCDDDYPSDRHNISPGSNRSKINATTEDSCYSGGFCPGTQALLNTYSDYLESSPLGNVDCTDYKNDGYEYITQSDESISPGDCIRCESPTPFRNHEGDACISGRCEPINESGNTIQQRVSGLDENDQPICERCEVGEHLNQDGTQCLSCGQDEFTATDEEGNTICKSINCTLPDTTSYIVTGNTPFNEDNELFNPTVKCAENYLGYPTIKKCSEAGENVILDGCYPTELFANKTKCGDFGSNSFVNMEEKCNNINKILLKNKNCKNEDCINTTYCCSNDAGENINNIFNNIHKLKFNNEYNEWVGSLNTKINTLDADNSTDISKITLNDNIISQIRSLITSRSNFKDKWIGSGVGEQLDDDIIWDRLTNSLKQYIDTDAELSSISDDDLTIAIKKYLINLDKPITDTDTGSNIYQKSPLDIFLFSKSYPSNVINQEDSDKIYPITLNNLL